MNASAARSRQDMPRSGTAENGSGAGSTLAHRFCRHIDESGLLSARAPVLVAVSGGLDSLCLLHLLRFGCPLPVSAAHFDHAMRPDSERDGAWLRGVCTAWDVPLHLERSPRPPRGETAAREQRYAFLHDAADRLGCTTILTAHHADDQAETVLFRLARGTGLPGLAGIPERRGAIARPLLPFSRRDLLGYARAVGLRWRDDPTNTDLRFARNRIRRRVLPELERMSPGAASRIAGLAARAAEAEAAWRSVLRGVLRDVVQAREEDAVALARERLLSYHPHVRARVLRHLLHRLGGRLDRAGTRVAMEFITSGNSGGFIELGGGVRLERHFERLVLRRAPHAVQHPDALLAIPTPVAGAGTFLAGGRRYAARWGSASSDAGSGLSARFDPSSLRFPLELRGWRAGDRITLPYGSKKLKKLFQERRIGRDRRASVPVLSDAEGCVLWVPGIARDARAPAPDSTAIFEIMVRDVESN